MSFDWDRAFEVHYEVAGYCPVCGKELEERRVFDDDMLGRRVYKHIKSCEGHCQLEVAGGDARPPRMEFELLEDFYRPLM